MVAWSRQGARAKVNYQHPLHAKRNSAITTKSTHRIGDILKIAPKGRRISGKARRDQTGCWFGQLLPLDVGAQYKFTAPARITLRVFAVRCQQHKISSGGGTNRAAICGAVSPKLPARNNPQHNQPTMGAADDEPAVVCGLARDQRWWTLPRCRRPLNLPGGYTGPGLLHRLIDARHKHVS